MNFLGLYVWILLRAELKLFFLWGFAFASAMSEDITNWDHSKLKLQFMIFRIGHTGYMNSGPKHVLRFTVKNSLEELLLFSTIFRVNNEIRKPTVPFWLLVLSSSPSPPLQGLLSHGTNSKPGFKVEDKQIPLGKQLQSLLKFSDPHYFVSGVGKFTLPFHKPSNTLKKKFFFYSKNFKYYILGEFSPYIA